jgi:hypothetical protein
MEDLSGELSVPLLGMLQGIDIRIYQLRSD